jgi:N-methylhydantoinase A/oxoprolinase/acetone carboxylase beta subunit
MLRVGVDVGGTFTDLFAWDAEAPEERRVREAKVLSTPEDPSIGVMRVLEAAAIEPAQIATIIHGTTIATNALIERRYPEPALVTTRGFRDVLEIGRQRRRRLYDPYQVKVPPLIERSRRFTVNERMGADGTTVTPLDRDEARRVAERIAEAGIRSVAVAFINAYADGRHEQEMRDILLETIPDGAIALSSETRPKMRELGRFVTTAIRAALLPTVGDYIGRLEQKLAEFGCTAPLFIVKSNGGMMSADIARRRPEELIESGPAGGVAAGSYLSYGRGGTRPTVTDANLVLGRIDPTLGGKLELDAAAAERAIRTVADPLGMSVLDCAEGIAEIVSENMAAAIRMVSTDRGRDPRDHVLVAFGGAGGLHAHQIAESVGIERVLVPGFAGVGCAFGAIAMDIRHDVEATFYAPTSEVDIGELNAAFGELEREVTELLEADGVDRADITIDRSAQMRYVGQSYEVTTPVPTGEVDADAVAAIANDFNRVHEQEYGVSSETFTVAFVTLRVTGIGRTEKPDPEGLSAAMVATGSGGNGPGSLKERRAAYFGGRHHEVDIHDAGRLTAGQTIAGPAIIEQADGVIVLPPGAVGEADRYDNVLITREKQA